VEDERVQAELQKLKREIAPQDENERRARIEAEVAETSAEMTDAEDACQRRVGPEICLFDLKDFRLAQH
jgi:hypothetical protein